MSVLVSKGTGSGWSSGLQLSRLHTVYVLPSTAFVCISQHAPRQWGFCLRRSACQGLFPIQSIVRVYLTWVPPSTTVLQCYPIRLCTFYLPLCFIPGQKKFISIMRQYSPQIIPDTSDWKPVLFFHLRTIEHHVDLKCGCSQAMPLP